MLSSCPRDSVVETVKTGAFVFPKILVIPKKTKFPIYLYNENEKKQ